MNTNNRTTAAFLALFDAVKDNPELCKLYGTLQDAVTAELNDSRSGYHDTRESFSQSIAGRAVLERAWAADPKRTELDLIQAGKRGLASALGAWWAGEEQRRKQSARGSIGPAGPLQTLG